MIALSVTALVVPLAALWLTQGDELERAVSSFPPLALLAAALAHLAWLATRSEAWRLSLNAIERPVARRHAHAASAAGYAAGTLQSAGGLPVRAVSLRRIGTSPPSIDRTLVAEAPVIALEGGLIALVFVVAVATAPVAPPWAAAAMLGGCLIALMAMGALAHRHPGHRAVAGLRVLADPRRRAALIAVVAAMTALGLLRAWVVLVGAGLPHGPASVAVLFAALGVLGALPLGPGSSPGAMLAVFGPVNAGAAAGAGIAMVASSLIAIVLYALLAGALAARWRRGPVSPDPITASR